MSRTGVTIASKKGDSTLVQARFGPGMLLHHDDLDVLAAYPRELSRLLFRSFFGCGVVCGLVVDTPVEKCGKVWLTVGAGLALGCSGDPIHVPKPQTFAIDEDCEPDPKLPTSFFVVLCPSSKCCAPRPAGCADDDEETPSVCTRERDGFEIRIVKDRPPCACGCDGAHTSGGTTTPPAEREECCCAKPTDPCYADHYRGICGCNGGDRPGCDCDCVLLARVDKREKVEPLWQVDHGVRRFIRPVLACDPLLGKVAAGSVPKKEDMSQGQGQQSTPGPTQEPIHATASSTDTPRTSPPAEGAEVAASVKSAAAAKPAAPKQTRARKFARTPKASPPKPTTPPK